MESPKPEIPTFLPARIQATLYKRVASQTPRVEKQGLRWQNWLAIADGDELDATAVNNFEATRLAII
jgi:hypothetical protein